MLTRKALSATIIDMLIGIDASRSFRDLRTGTERYSLEITRHLLALPQAAKHQWLLYTDVDPDQHPGELFTVPPFASIQYLSCGPMWTHRCLGRVLCRDNPDVFFVPAHVVPLRLPASRLPPSVVTIHDVGYRYFPESYGRFQRWYLEWSTRWSIYASSQVIAISQSTARDLSKFYGTSSNRLTVIYEGPPTLEQGVGDGQSNMRRFGLERPYGLFVGTLQPRKNLVRLLQAYARIYDRQRPEWDLVLVGARGWLSSEIEALAERLAGAVHMLGYVDDALLPALISGASFFCFPSLFEGFGLPILEAQHYGVPVMTSNNSSLPEVAGEAAILVDPLDVEAIADAMLRLSQDEELRQSLIAAGYENVKRFSWQKAAQETFTVLEKAARHGKG